MLPQHTSSPSAFTAHENVPPARTLRMLLTPATLVGALRPVVVLSPSCPFALRPQHISPPSERRALTINDRALYIYTSGTTGMPKAANVNHYRIMLASFGFAGVMNTRADDRMYDCLPMYHTVGGLVATGPLLVRGASTVIRERFSVREFWDDIVRYEDVYGRS